MSKPPDLELASRSPVSPLGRAVPPSTAQAQTHALTVLDSLLTQFVGGGLKTETKWEGEAVRCEASCARVRILVQSDWQPTEQQAVQRACLNMLYELCRRPLKEEGLTAAAKRAVVDARSMQPGVWRQGDVYTQPPGTDVVCMGSQESVWSWPEALHSLQHEAGVQVSALLNTASGAPSAVIAFGVARSAKHVIAGIEVPADLAAHSIEDVLRQCEQQAQAWIDSSHFRIDPPGTVCQLRAQCELVRPADIAASPADTLLVLLSVRVKRPSHPTLVAYGAVMYVSHDGSARAMRAAEIVNRTRQSGFNLLPDTS